jgi:hypothetical protein
MDTFDFGMSVLVKLWLPQSAPGPLYSRDLRVGIHPQLHEITAPGFLKLCDEIEDLHV